ncbi:50S ribosomal protein L24 [bacterium]|nr:50S ribosomal protein L24 [bacterium]
MFKSKPKHKISKTNKIRKDDTVKVITGKDKGKTGKVIRVLPRKGRVLVENINMIYKNMRKTKQHQQGGILRREGPIEITNLLVVCSKCGRSTRVGFTKLEDGRKVRTCKKCEEIMT